MLVYIPFEDQDFFLASDISNSQAILELCCSHKYCHHCPSGFTLGASQNAPGPCVHEDAPGLRFPRRRVRKAMVLRCHQRPERRFAGVSWMFPLCASLFSCHLMPACLSLKYCVCKQTHMWTHKGILEQEPCVARTQRLWLLWNTSPWIREDLLPHFPYGSFPPVQCDFFFFK